MRCVVTGASGFIGSHLVDALLTAGHEVIGIVRPTSDLRWLQDTAATLVPCAPGDNKFVQALEGATHVYHVAGAIAGSAQYLLAVNEGLTRRILEAAVEAGGMVRLIYVSTLSAAGSSIPGTARTEDMPANPVSDYGRSKLAGERAVLEFGDRLPSTIIRPPVVYGPRDRGLLGAFRLANIRLVPQIGRDRRLSLIYVDDLVRGIVLAGESAKATGKTYYMSHPETISMVEFGKALASALGRRSLPIPVNDILLRGAGRVAGWTARFGSPFGPFGSDKVVEMLQAGWVCDSSRALEDLGFIAEVSHQEGIERTARWYREQGWL